MISIIRFLSQRRHKIKKQGKKIWDWCRVVNSHYFRKCLKNPPHRIISFQTMKFIYSARGDVNIVARPLRQPTELVTLTRNHDHSFSQIFALQLSYQSILDTLYKNKTFKQIYCKQVPDKHRLVNSRYFKKVKNTRTQDFKRNKHSFQIPYQNSRGNLVCLLPVLFLFLEYQRSLVYV